MSVSAGAGHSRAAEARLVAMIRFFWIVEDALWFALNPAFGWNKFSPAHAPWHKRWWSGAPVDYWIAMTIALVLFIWSYRARSERRSSRA